MMKHRLLTFIILVAFLLLLFLIPMNWLSFITSPFISGARYVQSFYLNLLNQRTDIGRAAFESLKKERDLLREEVILLREENYKLRYILGVRVDMLREFRQIYPAQVVQTHLGRGERSYVIQGGIKNQFQSNDVVVSTEGLVGRITSPGRYYSRVLLIVDRNSSLPAMVQESRLQGIIYGTGSWNELIMELDDPAKDVQEGDIIVTSGMGTIYPAGILIGFTREILPDRYGLPQKIIVEPAVNFHRLEIVGVTPSKSDHEIF